MLCTMTSARPIRRRSTAAPAGCLRSSTTERLLRLTARWIELMPGWRATPAARAMSPSGGSILITSAPRSPRIWVASGPSTTAVRSMTVTPASGPAGALIAAGGPSEAAAHLQIAEPAQHAFADLEELQGEMAALPVDVQHARL